MGYTHYMSHKIDFTDEQWDKLTTFATNVIAATDIPIGDIEISDECIDFNGVGEDAYENFLLFRGAEGGFCKTERKPYDAVVVAMLLYAHEIAPDKINITSDGDIFGYGPDKWDERTTAMNLMNKVLNQ